MDVPFRLAFSANAFRRYTPQEAIATVASIGYAGIELMFDEPHLVPTGVDPATVAAVRQALLAHDLAVSNVNAFTMRMLGDTWHPSWIEPEAAPRRQRIEHTMASLVLAGRFEARSISTEPGGPLPDGMTREAAMATFLAGIAEVLPVAEAAGVALLIEPEPGLLIETSDAFLDFIERIESPMVGLNFDVGHFYCVGEDPVEAFEKLRPYVRHVHLEDIAATREHRHLAPGEGAIDLPRFLRALADADYDGFVTVELYPYQDDPAATARNAHDYLQNISADDAD